MKKHKVLIATHASLIPPETVDGLTMQQVDAFRVEYDVRESLRRLGHEVSFAGIRDSLAPLRDAVQEGKPDLVFNLLEEFDGIVTYDHHMVGVLELLRQPYTGCNPRGMMISRDKVLTKQLLAYHRIPTPDFTVFPRGHRVKVSRKQRYPAFVKSATEDASLGIAQASVVDDAAKLKERIEFIHEQVASDALVEEYVPGREIYMGVLGNERLTVLPPRELQFGALAEGQAPIATRKVKWDRKYQARHGIQQVDAEGLPAGLEERLAAASKRIFRALHLSGYARMDFRVREDGAIFVLEANCNPNLAAIEDFAQSANRAGVSYDALIARILSLGLAWRAAWRMYEG
jgi:D-alanine-D-alanine ligase